MNSLEKLTKFMADNNVDIVDLYNCFVLNAFVNQLVLQNILNWEKCFKNFLQNFGDESQFWWFWDFDIDFKILKKSCENCYPILGPILENFDHRILVKSQSYDKPPWRNFDFWSNFVEIENFGF